MTHGFFADNHVLNLHDLRDVIGSWFERRSARPVVDANKNVSADVITAINTCQSTDNTRQN